MNEWMNDEWFWLLYSITHTHNCNYTFGLSRSYANQSTSHSTSQPSCHACHSFIIIIIMVMMVMIGAICHRSFLFYLSFHTILSIKILIDSDKPSICVCVYLYMCQSTSDDSNCVISPCIDGYQLCCYPQFYDHYELCRFKLIDR